MKKYLENIVYALIVALVLGALLSMALYQLTPASAVGAYLITAASAWVVALALGVWYHRRRWWTWEGYLWGAGGATAGTLIGSLVTFAL